MKINGDMLILAREFRDITQKEVAEKAKIAQSTVAKIEGGLRPEVSDELALEFSKILRFPIEFLAQEEELLSYGSSAYFYRKRATMPAPDRRRIHSVVNMLRIAVRKCVSLVDIQPRRALPVFDIEEYGSSASKVAMSLRGAWAVPDGPIRDLTELIESAGVLVIPCDFGTRLIDATSLRLSDMPPMIFINKALPGDRWRYTLAHELGHLVMHTIPHEKMEDEADEFAAEFLTPAAQIRPQLMQVKSWKIREMANLKLFWRVSFRMLVYRANKLNVISKDTARSAYIALAPDRLVEPVPIEQEKTNSLWRVISAITDDLKYNLDGLTSFLKWPEDLTAQLLPSSRTSQPKLRLVTS